jgi:hypothetical protein
MGKEPGNDLLLSNPSSKEEECMKTWGTRGLLAAVMVIAVTSIAFTAPWKGWQGSGGWGTENAYQRIYNPAMTESLSGEVVSVEEIKPMKGMRAGIHLLVKSGKETVSVHLGPAWYIERLDTQISEGDTIEIKGSRVSFEGKPAIIAAEIKKGDVVLRLRDDQGISVWSGWRRSR